MNDIANPDVLIRSLPDVLKNDRESGAMTAAFAKQLAETGYEIQNCILYARLNELPETILDLLAYDMHIDWYDCNYSVEIKRQVIRNSVRVHKHLGTKYAVETALSDVFPGTTIEEWFEYGGDPYTFRIIIDVSESGATEAQLFYVLNKVKFYKNLRSHLESIRYTATKTVPVHTGAYYKTGQTIDVYPYWHNDAKSRGGVYIGGTVCVFQELQIYPMKDKSWR